MDNDLKIKLDAIETKLDMSIAHREKMCKLLHAGIDDHLKEAPKFRDKIVANSIWMVACWSVVCLMLAVALYTRWQ